MVNEKHMSKLPKGKLKEAVEHILFAYPQSRDDDSKLVVWTWWHLFPASFKDGDHKCEWVRVHDVMQTFPNPDHITRIRRKFQEGGRYPCNDPEVARKRNKEQETWRGFAQTGDFQPE
jgi:hypothetical protein